MTTKEIVVSLSQGEALVLFEFLSRFDETNVLDIIDQSEEFVLIRVLNILRLQLAEPFSDDYLKILEKARSELRWDDS